MELLRDYVDSLATVFLLLILVRILMSFIPMSPVRPLARAGYDFVTDSTDWYLNFFRRFIPPIGPIDLSPMVGIIVLFIVKDVVLRLIPT